MLKNPRLDMNFKDLKKLVMGDIKIEELGIINIEAFLFNLSEDKKYSVKVEFVFRANAAEFLSQKMWEVALTSMVDKYFEKVRNLIPTEMLSEFFEKDKERRDKLKAELIGNEMICKVESKGKIFKSPVIVLRQRRSYFSIDMPFLFGGNINTLAHSVTKVGYEIIINSKDKNVRKRLFTVLGKEFSI